MSEIKNKIFIENPNLNPLFGYWEFKYYHQRFFHWLLTGVWPKKTWIKGLSDCWDMTNFKDEWLK